MKLRYPQSKNLLSVLVFFTFFITANAQVGINTTAPSAGAMLDVETTNKGMLIPRVSIANLNNISPITGGSTESLLVYNTNTSTGKGFYYWDSSMWVPVGNGKFWNLAGNAGTTPGTGAGQKYLGTSDNQNFLIGTNGTSALTIDTNQRLLAANNGTNALPTYSFGADSDTGIWRSAADRLNITSGGVEFIEFKEGGSGNELTINDGSADVDTRIETDGEANMLFVDGGTNRIGIKTASPQTALHVAGASSTVRVESLNSANSTFNNGIDASVVMIDTNGDLILQDRVDDFPLDASDTTGATTFMATPIAIDSPTGVIAVALGYTTTFTLTRETLIEVVFWTAVNIANSGGVTYPRDGKPRLFGGLVSHQATGQDIIYSATTYTNASLGAGAGLITTGFTTIGGNGFINLPAGTHTINLLLFANGGELDPSTATTEGIRATFGANTYNRFQIIYHN